MALCLKKGETQSRFRDSILLGDSIILICVIPAKFPSFKSINRKNGSFPYTSLLLRRRGSKTLVRKSQELLYRTSFPRWTISDRDAMPMFVFFYSKDAISMVFSHFLLSQSLRLFLVHHQDQLFSNGFFQFKDQYLAMIFCGKPSVPNSSDSLIFVKRWAKDWRFFSKNMGVRQAKRRAKFHFTRLLLRSARPLRG